MPDEFYTDLLIILLIVSVLWAVHYKVLGSVNFQKYN